MTTQKEIAKIAKVSRMAVYKVMHSLPGVSEDKRDEISRLLKKHNYAPNFYVPIIQGRKVNPFVAVVTLESFGNIKTLLLELNRNLSRHGLDGILVSREEYGQEIAEMLARRRFGGYINICAGMSPAEAKMIGDAEVPLISFDSNYLRIAGVPTVMPDTRRNMRTILSFLAGKGHRTLGIVTNGQERRVRNYKDPRLLSIRKLASEFGFEIRDEWILLGGDDLPLAKTETDRLAKMRHRPSAIFGYNDYTCLAVIHALAINGLKVPEEISIIGHDGIEQGEYYTPALTTLDLNMPKVAETLVEALCGWMDGSIVNRKKLIAEVCGSILERASVAQQ